MAEQPPREGQRLSWSAENFRRISPSSVLQRLVLVRLFTGTRPMNAFCVSFTEMDSNSLSDSFTDSSID